MRNNEESNPVILNMQEGFASSVPSQAAPDASSCPTALGRRRPLRAQGLCARAASRFVWVAVLAALPVACTKPLSVRRDAGAAQDTRREDAAADLPVEAAAPPDLPADRAALRDLAAPDLVDGGGSPKRFRIENQTDRTAYVTVDPTVACHILADAGWIDCSFFALSCLWPCTTVPASGDCCVLCERPLPAVYPIAPGESRALPWDGRLYAQATGTCSACNCQQETTVQIGWFEASLAVYADYLCSPGPCANAPDGSISLAYPRGSSITVTTRFAVPYADEDVVLAIISVPTTDAGMGPDLGPPDLAQADLAPTDLGAMADRATDALPAPFIEIPGHTYQIAASNTAPDASARSWNWPCTPHDASATYDLVFAADGSTVHIVRTDPVQEETMDGDLSEASDSQLVYTIDNHWAGAELVVRIDNDTLVAQLAIFGSGLPVVSCIESPMTVN